MRRGAHLLDASGSLERLHACLALARLAGLGRQNFDGLLNLHVEGFGRHEQANDLTRRMVEEHAGDLTREPRLDGIDEPEELVAEELLVLLWR